MPATPSTPFTPVSRPRLHKQGWLSRGFRKVCTGDDVKVPQLRCIPCDLRVPDKHVLRHTRTANHQETLPEFLDELRKKGMPREVLDDEAEEIGVLLKAEMDETDGTPSGSKTGRTLLKDISKQTPVKGQRKWKPLTLWLAEGVTPTKSEDEQQQFVCTACSTPSHPVKFADDRHSLCKHILSKKHRDRQLSYLTKLVRSPGYLSHEAHLTPSLAQTPASASASSPALNGYTPTAKPSRARKVIEGTETPSPLLSRTKSSAVSSARSLRVSRAKVSVKELPSSTPDNQLFRRSRIKAFPPQPNLPHSHSPQHLPLAQQEPSSSSAAATASSEIPQEPEISVKLERESPPPVIIARGTVKRDIGDMELEFRYEAPQAKKAGRNRSVSVASVVDESTVDDLV
ncbi:hypothetical protein IAR50_002823 [Cryptococcus sp. DSM 104548]